MTTEVSELITRLRMKDETEAGLAAANDRLRKVAETAGKAEAGLEGVGAAAKATDREFSAAGRSIGTVVRSIDGTAAATAAANRVLRQHADAAEKVRLQYEREGRSAAALAEALRRLEVVRDSGLAKARAAGARIEAQFAGAAAAPQAAEQLSRFGTVAEQVQRATEGMSGRLGAAGAALSALGAGGAVAAAALAGIGAGLAAVAKAGDDATATLGRLQAATGSAAAARDVYQRLYEASQRTGIAVAEAAGTFQRFQIAAGEIGATREQVLRLTEGLQKVAIVAGSTGQEGGAAMMQLGQALASGRLNGDELRSLMENMPSLAQQLARELGTNIGQLRKMGEEGQLTADKVFPALLKATERMAGDFDKMPLTMSRSFDILGSAMTNFAAKLDEALGLSQAIARAVKAAADAVNGVRRSVLPTEREQLTDAAGAARARLSALQGNLFSDEQIGGTRFEADRVRLQQRNEDTRRQMRAIESELRTHNDRLAEIEKEGQADRFGQFVSAQQKAADAARTRGEAEFKEAEGKAQKLVKLERDYLAEVQKVDAVDRPGSGVSSDRIWEQRRALADQYFKDRQKILKELEGDEDKAGRKAEAAAAKEAKARDTVLAKLATELDAKQRLAMAQGQGADAVAALNQELEIENRLREAGIPISGKRTEEEERFAERIGATVRAIDVLKRAEKEGAEARADATRESERAAREIEGQSRRVSDDVATSIYEGLVEKRRGQGVLDWFGNLFKRIAIQAASTQIFLPITTAIVGGIPQLFGIGGAAAAGGRGGGLGDLLGLSSLLPKEGILGALGLSGPGGLLSTQIISPFGGQVVGPIGEVIGGSTGATFGSLLGGFGAGFGAGTFLNTLLGGNQTGGMVGSGVGAAAGAIIGSLIPGVGTLLGGLLGGLGGGGLGGLFGPGAPNKGWSFALRGSGPADGWEPGTALRMTDSFYNEQGREQFAQAQAMVEQVNAFMAANNLTVWGARAIGGSKDGLGGLGYGEAASMQELFASLHFGSSGNADLNRYLQGQTFADPQKLAEAVQGFNAAQAAITALTAEAIPAFTQQLNAINAQFDAAAEQARKYGLSEVALTSARAAAIAKLEAQRAETLRQTSLSLNVRYLTALGRESDAALVTQAENAAQEVRALTESLTQLGISAADQASFIDRLLVVQAAERAKILEEQTRAAREEWTRFGQSIRSYLDGLASGTAGGASPADRLAAAQAVFARDRSLAMGGDRDALGRITSSADALLGAGREVYASGAGYQALLAQVAGGLSSLPVVQSYDAAMAASLAAIQAAVQSGQLGTLTSISASGNIVQIAGGIDMSAVVAGLAAVQAAQAATNTISVATGDAVVRALAVAATGAVAIGNAHTTALAAINQSLATLDASSRDLNVSLATIHSTAVAVGGAQVQGLASLNQSLATINATLVAGQAAIATNIATHAANDNAAFVALGTIQNLGNTIAAQTATNTSIAAGRLSVVDNTLQAANNYAIAGNAHLLAGNTIAAEAARMAVETANAQNTILAASNTNLVAALNAGNTIAAADAAHSSAIRSYLSFVDNTTKAMSNYAIEHNQLLRQVLAALAQIDALMREVARVELAAEREGVDAVTEAVNGLRRPLERALAKVA